MSKNGSMKERTLDKLREESSTIYQGTRLIVFLNALFAITCIIMLVLSFVFSSTVTEMRSDTAQRGFPFYRPHICLSRNLGRCVHRKQVLLITAIIFCPWPPSFSPPASLRIFSTLFPECLNLFWTAEHRL